MLLVREGGCGRAARPALAGIAWESVYPGNVSPRLVMASIQWRRAILGGEYDGFDHGASPFEFHFLPGSLHKACFSKTRVTCCQKCQKHDYFTA